MSERSLICLTAFALVTGVVLLVASSSLVGFIGIESPHEGVAVDSEPLHAHFDEPFDGDVAADCATEIPEDETTPNESMGISTVIQEPPVAQEYAPEEPLAMEPGVDVWTPVDTVAIPTEPMTTEPATAVEEQEPLRAVEVVGQETTTLPEQAYIVESDEAYGYEADAASSPTYNTEYAVPSYGNPDPAVAGYTPPTYERAAVEPYANEYENYTTGEPQQPSPGLSSEATPSTYTYDVGSQVEPTAEMVDTTMDVIQTAAIADFPQAMPQAPTSPVAPQGVSGEIFPAEQAPIDDNPLRLSPPLNRVAQVPRATGPAEAEILEPERLDDTAEEGNSNEEIPSLENEETRLGEEPEETTTELQFLRRQSVLLDPGQYQFDVTLQYLINDDDFPLAQQVGNLIQIGEAGRKQRLLLLPIEFRIGLTPVSQLFVNVPFGWSNGEFAFQGVDEFQNSGGIGDVSAGITRILIEGNDCFPDVLSTISFSAPTGDSNFVTSLSTPGNTLGEGFWTLTAGLSFIQTFDPVVVFYGFGYRHRFENNFDVNVGDGKITVNPGKQIFYRFGAGFAVNPQVTLSASFIGSYLTEDYVEGVRLAGSIREPMSVRLAATISKDKELKKGQRIRTVEPFISFGVTDDAANALFGVSCTH